MSHFFSPFFRLFYRVLEEFIFYRPLIPFVKQGFVGHQLYYFGYEILCFEIVSPLF